MPTHRTALIAGATGLVGREVLARLQGDERYDRVRVLSRRPVDVAGDKLTVHVDDFERLPALAEEQPTLFAVDDVFCCLGTTLAQAGSKAAFEAVDYGHVVALARACAAQGAQRLFLVSAVGANARSPNFYSRVKGRTEQAVSELGFATVHLVRPSLLLGQREDNRAGEALGQRLAPVLSPLLAGPLRRLRPVRADAVAAHMLELAAGDARGVNVSYPDGS